MKVEMIGWNCNPDVLSQAYSVHHDTLSGCLVCWYSCNTSLSLLMRWGYVHARRLVSISIEDNPDIMIRKSVQWELAR